MDYRPNSHKSKEVKEASTTEKKVEKVVTGVVKPKKKGEISKLTGAIISEDASSVGNYVMMEIIVPALKRAISDVVSKGVNMMLYGDTERPRNGDRAPASRVSYGKQYVRESDRRGDYEPRRARSTYDYDDFVINDYGEAEEVKERMLEIMDEYGVVSVSDYYDLLGVTSGNFTDCKYGWTSLRTIDIVRVRDGGYMIKLPRATALN